MKARIALLAVFVQCGSLLASQSPTPKKQQSPAPIQPINESGKPIVSDKNAEIQKEIDAIRKDIQSLKGSVFGLRYGKADARTSARLSPSNPDKYERVDTDSGTFLLSLGEVTPYLDGHKIKVAIGNINAAYYVGFKLDLRWFSESELYQEKEESFTQTLEPQSFTTVTVVLPRTKSEDLLDITIELKTDTVRLKQGR